MAMRFGALVASRCLAGGSTCPASGLSAAQVSLSRASFLDAAIRPVRTASRSLSTVKFMDEKRSGEETVYFKKEDELLLRNLLANHPEYDPKYAWNESELGTLAKDVTLACQKHGMKDPSAAFLKDLISIFASHGYKKAGTAK